MNYLAQSSEVTEKMLLHSKWFRNNWTPLPVVISYYRGQLQINVLETSGKHERKPLRKATARTSSNVDCVPVGQVQGLSPQVH